MSLFIVLDGVDGAGKTTQIVLLATALRERGYKVFQTAEPSDLPIGKLIRSFLRREFACSLSAESLAMLFAADRLHHVEHEIAPALGRGEIVLCDRYDASSIAYQTAMMGGGETARAYVAQLNGKARRPDLTFLLDLDPQVAATRRQTRGSPEELLESYDLQQQLRHEYRQFPTVRPNDCVQQVDASIDPQLLHQNLLERTLEQLTKDAKDS